MLSHIRNLKIKKMNLKIYFLSNFKSLILKIAMLSSVLFASCIKDKMEIPLNIAMVNFSSDSYTIVKNNVDAYTITLPLSLPLEKDGTIKVSIDTSGTADTSNFSIDPDISSDIIILNLHKDAIEATFTVTSKNNFADDKKIVFKINSSSGGIILANNNLISTVTMKGNNPTTPEITTSLASLDDFGLITNGSASSSKSYTISGRNLTQNVAVVASDNFKVSVDNVSFSNVLSIDFNNVNNSSVVVFVKFIPLSGSNQTITGAVLNSSTGVLTAVSLSGQEDGNTISILLMNEDFNYGISNASLTNFGGWIGYSGAGLTPVAYIPSGLTFPGYPTVGGAVTTQNGSGSREDVNKIFNTQSSGKIYIAQLVKISAAGTGDFLLALRDASGGFFNRLYAKDVGGSLSLGIGRNTSPEYSPTSLSYQTTYLVVIKYNFTTQTSSMYILSGTPPSIEPTPDAVASAGSIPASLNDLVIRQSSGVLNSTIDGIRISTSWKGALGL